VKRATNFLSFGTANVELLGSLCVVLGRIYDLRNEDIEIKQIKTYLIKAEKTMKVFKKS
jgi:hypothetical protein